MLIYPFAPADAAFTQFGVTRAQFPVPSDVPWTTGPVVHAIKDGARIVTKDSLKGLVTFPSYHAAVAASLIWASWSLRWLRAPIILWNLAMLVSCILVGAHYLVDLIAGIAVAFVSIRFAIQIVPGTPAKPPDRKDVELR